MFPCSHTTSRPFFRASAGVRTPRAASTHGSRRPSVVVPIHPTGKPVRRWIVSTKATTSA